MTIPDALAQSVQQHPAPEYGIRDLSSFIGMANTYSLILPYEVGNGRRDWALRNYSRNPQAGMWQSAVSGFNRDVAGTPFEVKGKRRVRHYQQLMLDAHYGEGWSYMWLRIGWDMATYDAGGVMEIIGRGRPDQPLDREAVTGVAHLDALRCFFTGNPEYPVWYRDKNGGWHQMHNSRVARFLYQPISQEEDRMFQLSPLAQAIGDVMQAITQQTYIGEMLNEQLPPGLLWGDNLTNIEAFRKAEEDYLYDLQNRDLTRYKKIMKYIQTGGSVAGAALQLNFMRFAQAPEGFNPYEYRKMQAIGIANALGIDVQDIMPLDGGAFGRDGQSRVLDRKAKGKSDGYVLSLIRRIFNTKVLPDYLELDHKEDDSEQSLQQAQVAKAHAEVAKEIALIPGLPEGAAAAYLQATVAPLRDAILSAEGQIRLHDADAVPPDTDVVPPDTNTVGEDDSPLPGADKAFDDTEMNFAFRFYSVVADYNQGQVDRARARTLLDSIATNSTRRAMIDGLAEGGVIVEQLEGDDLNEHLSLMTETRGYISDMLRRVGNLDEPMTDTDLRLMTDMWVNKTLERAHLIGVASADRNGMYEFAGFDGLESCNTCQRLRGQVHRMRSWTESRMRPGVDTDNFDCGGWLCQHRLQRTESRARGRLKSLIGQLGTCEHGGHHAVYH